MAYQVGSACYSTAQAALSAAASAQVGAVVQHGGSAFVVDAQASGSSITYTFKAADGSSTFANTVALSPQPCGLLDWQDGLTLGWAVAAVWLVVAGVMFLRRGVHL